MIVFSTTHAVMPEWVMGHAQHQWGWRHSSRCWCQWKQAFPTLSQTWLHWRHGQAPWRWPNHSVDEVLGGGARRNRIWTASADANGHYIKLANHCHKPWQWIIVGRVEDHSVGVCWRASWKALLWTSGLMETFNIEKKILPKYDPLLNLLVELANNLTSCLSNKTSSLNGCVELIEEVDWIWSFPMFAPSLTCQCDK